MDHSLEESSYLQHQRASTQTVECLYQHGFIQAAGKDYALDQIAPKPAWKYQCSVFMQMLAIGLFITGVLIAILYQWPYLSTQYQLITLMMGILCGIYGAFVFSTSKWASQLLLLTSSGLIGFLTFKLLLLQRPLFVIGAFGALGIAVLFVIIFRCLPQHWFKRSHS